jgi:hypothetical protein
VRVRIDFGIGVVLLGRRSPEVEDVLDEAQRLAEAARRMRTRAATFDLLTGATVAIEEAQLRVPPARHRSGMTPTMASLQRSER